MKQIVIFLTAFIAMFSAMNYIERHYTITATVDTVRDGIVTFEDHCGYLWQWSLEEGDTPVYEGDTVTLKFDNQCSSSRYDDVITAYFIQ